MDDDIFDIDNEGQFLHSPTREGKVTLSSIIADNGIRRQDHEDGSMAEGVLNRKIIRRNDFQECITVKEGLMLAEDIVSLVVHSYDKMASEHAYDYDSFLENKLGDVLEKLGERNNMLRIKSILGADSSSESREMLVDILVHNFLYRNNMSIAATLISLDKAINGERAYDNSIIRSIRGSNVLGDNEDVVVQGKKLVQVVSGNRKRENDDYEKVLLTKVKADKEVSRKRKRPNDGVVKVESQKKKKGNNDEETLSIEATVEKNIIRKREREDVGHQEALPKKIKIDMDVAVDSSRKSQDADHKEVLPTKTNVMGGKRKIVLDDPVVPAKRKKPTDSIQEDNLVALDKGEDKVNIEMDSKSMTSKTYAVSFESLPRLPLSESIKSSLVSDNLSYEGLDQRQKDLWSSKDWINESDFPQLMGTFGLSEDYYDIIPHSSNTHQLEFAIKKEIGSHLCQNLYGLISVDGIKALGDLSRRDFTYDNIISILRWEDLSDEDCQFYTNKIKQCFNRG